MIDPVEHAGHASKAAGHGLGKQLGPFPLGVWLLIVVGGVGLTQLVGRKRVATSGSVVPIQPVGVDQSAPPVPPTIGSGTAGPGFPEGYGSGFYDGFVYGTKPGGAGSDPSQPVVTPGAGGTTPPVAATPTPTRAPGVAAPGAPPRGTAGTVAVNGRTVHVNAAGIIDTPGAGYGRYPVQEIQQPTPVQPVQNRPTTPGVKPPVTVKPAAPKPAPKVPARAGVR
ncbi:MAG: hypothetical protein JWO67_14 [Streptosporangiaceae bacterium]|nr:hypothetical protein [Streptosporangiaceae bacterium]